MTDFSYHGNTIYYSVYYIPFLVFSRIKETEKGKKKQERKKCVVIHRQTGNHISSLVRYVTAHDTHAFTKKSSSGKNHISLVKYFTPQDTKFISLQNNRKFMLGI